MNFRLTNLFLYIILLSAFVFHGCSASPESSSGKGNSSEITVTNTINVTNYTVTTNTETVGYITYQAINSTNETLTSWYYDSIFSTTNSDIICISNCTVSNGYTVYLWQNITNETISNTTITNLYMELIGSGTNKSVSYYSHTNNFYFTNYFLSTNCTTIDFGFAYTVSNGTAVITGLSSTWSNASANLQSHLTIPSSLNGYSVTAIGRSAFINCTNLTNMTISPGVISIEPYAFYSCRGLTNITIPSGVTSIGERAFNYCFSLKNVTLPSGVVSVGYCAFEACTGLTNITLPQSLTNIGDFAFNACSRLTNIILPYELTSVSYCMLANTSLTNIIIPPYVTNIGRYAFDGCFILSNMTIPSSVVSIGSNAFRYCYNLKNIYDYAAIPQTIDSSIFYYPITVYVPADSFGLYQTNWLLAGYLPSGSSIVSQ